MDPLKTYPEEIRTKVMRCWARDIAPPPGERGMQGKDLAWYALLYAADWIDRLRERLAEIEQPKEAPPELTAEICERDHLRARVLDVEAALREVSDENLRLRAVIAYAAVAAREMEQSARHIRVEREDLDALAKRLEAIGFR